MTSTLTLKLTKTLNRLVLIRYCVYTYSQTLQQTLQQSLQQTLQETLQETEPFIHDTTQSL